MTDKIAHLTVVLDENLRDEDGSELNQIIAAISIIRGVTAVSKGKPVDASTFIAQSRVRLDLGGRLIQLARDISNGK